MPEMHLWANKEAEKANQRLQQQSLTGSDRQQAQQPAQPVPEPQHVSPSEKEEPGPPPEKNQADWRRMLGDPDYRRQVEK
jgi:hypothetical protein